MLTTAVSLKERVLYTTVMGVGGLALGACLIELLEELQLLAFCVGFIL